MAKPGCETEFQISQEKLESGKVGRSPKAYIGGFPDQMIHREHIRRPKPGNASCLPRDLTVL